MDLRALRKLARPSSQSSGDASNNTVRNAWKAKQDVPEIDMVDGASSSSAVITKMAKDAVAIIGRSSATQPRGKASPSKRRYVTFDQLEYATTCSGKTVDNSMKQLPREEVVPKRKKRFDLLEYARVSKKHKVVIETPDQPALAHYSAAVQPIGAEDIMLTPRKAVQNSSEEIENVTCVGFDDTMASSVEQSRLTGTSHQKEASSAASSIVTPTLLRNADDIMGAANDASSLTPVGGAQSALSEYEKSRARNIERNNARLRSLGLITVAQERRANDAAWGRGSVDDDEEDTVGKKSAKKKTRSSAFIPRDGSRKSNRRMNIPAENGMVAERVYRDKRLDENFAAKLGLVREFWELHGRFPGGNEATPHDITLANWVSHNRNLLYFGRLAPDRAAAINAVHPGLLKWQKNSEKTSYRFRIWSRRGCEPSLIERAKTINTTCSVCFEEFDHDPTAVKNKLLSHLPVQSSRCCHKICYSCLRQIKLSVADDKNRDPSSIKWVKCPMGCRINTCFNTEDPIVDLHICSLIEGLRSGTMSDVITTCPLCYEEFDDDPSAVKDKLLSHLPVQSSRCCHKICYSCVRQIKLSEADDKNKDPSAIKWVKCPMGCRINTCFNTEDPIVDLQTCKLINELRSKTLDNWVSFVCFSQAR